MDIGGHDIEIEVKEQEGVLDRARSAVLSVWTDGVVELDEFDTSSLFIYRSKAAKESWDMCGWDEANCNDMIMLSHNGSMHCVLEDPRNPEMAKILDAIRAAVAEA